METPALSEYETFYLLKVTRHPDEFKRALHYGEELETVRAAMNEAGYKFQLKSGASVFVPPEHFDAVLELLTPLALRPYHVIVAETFKPLVYEAVSRLPCRSKVKVCADQPIALLNGDVADDVLIVENTFWDVPSRLRKPNAVPQSTTEMHGGGINPRRRVGE